jgi:hypothetical protein
MALRRLPMHRTASFPIHNVKQRSLLRSRRELLRPGSFSSLSLLSVGWVERQQHPSPAFAGPGSMGFAQGAQPILRNSYLPFLRSRDIRARVLFPFLPSQLPIPDRGDGGAPGGGILYPVARVIARRHVCEAWAVPRNRNGASRRSTVTVLGPLRAPPPELPPARFATRTSRARFTDRGRDATSRSAFRIVSGDAPR